MHLRSRTALSPSVVVPSDVHHITRTAYAKINLALHVTGQRDDGYHLLDMLVAFAEFGDLIHIRKAEYDTFDVSGPFGAAIPADGDNLVLRARDAIRASMRAAKPDQHQPLAIELVKNLPIAAGIGGGSSDAAATLAAMSELLDLPLPKAELDAIGLKLGADVPMCLRSQTSGTPLFARGIGEAIMPVADIPALPVVMINDGTGISTPSVFRALEKRDNAPLAPLGPFPHCDADDGIASLCDYLSRTRNDLLAAACTLAPQLPLRLAFLRETGAMHAQMSGSGATCFAIYASENAAISAASEIADLHPSWFVTTTTTIPSTRRI